MNVPATTPVAPAPHGDFLDPSDPELWPDVTNIITEDDTPVDNPFSEKQMRLLVEALYACWPGPADGRPFRVVANVGLMSTPKTPMLVPAVMLGLGVTTPEDIMVKEHRAWFSWIVGKYPDAVVEVVSNPEGGQDTTKMDAYARICVPYYVIYDPKQFLGKEKLRGFVLHGGKYQPIDPRRLPNIELGLKVWRGKFEDMEAEWLRWCDAGGRFIPTGVERAELEHQARQTAEQARQTAEQALQAAEQAQQSADQRADRLAAKLRALGVDPAA